MTTRPWRKLSGVWSLINDITNVPCLTIDLRPVRRTLHLTLHDRGYDARASALALLGRFCSDSHPLHSCRVTELALAAVSATTHEAHAALQELLAAREALWTRSSHGSSTPSRLSLASTLAQELVRLKEQLVRVRLKVKPAAVRLEVKPADWCKQQEEIQLQRMRRSLPFSRQQQKSHHTRGHAPLLASKCSANPWTTSARQ